MIRRLLLATVSFLALTSAVRADPISVAILSALGYSGAAGLLAPTAVLLTIATNSIIAALPSILLSTAIAVGSALISNSLNPQQPQPKPSDQQQTIRQSVGPRRRFYGRNKVGGTMWFFESKDGVLYSGITLNQGEIEGIVETWLSDEEVTLDVDGYVLEAPFTPTTDSPGLIRIQFKLGSDTETAYSTLTTDFSGVVTSDHRNRGVATALITYQDVSKERVSEVYPRGAPGFRAVIDAVKVYDPREGTHDATDKTTWEWSDNPALCVMDYLTHPDGMGLPRDKIYTSDFIALADICDELVALKGGGAIKRYRLWGGYLLSELAKDVLPRMLLTCDADLYMTPDGLIGIRGGQWEAPTVTIGPDQILSADWRRGQGALRAFNELTFTYVDVDHDYQEVEGQAWIDEADQTLRGRVLASQVNMYMVPHHAQARRLAKIMSHRQNPEWIGTLSLNFAGMALVGQRTVQVVFPDLGIDQPMQITGLRFDGNPPTGVTIEVSSLSEDAYEWDEDAEEGEPPAIPPDTSTESDLSPPNNIHVAAGEDGTGTFLVAVWDRPTRTSLIQQSQIRLHAGGPYSEMTVISGEQRGKSGYLTAGEDYDVVVRNVTPAGVPGEFSTPVTETATADLTAPGVVTSLLSTGGDGEILLSWTQPASTNGVGALVYYGTTNVFGSSTPVDAVYGGPGASLSFVIEPLSAGTYYVWVVSLNASDVPGTEVPTGAVIVT